MRSDLPSGSVTFLFTDVEGSTRLLHEFGAEGYAQALAEHRRVIREACAAEGGVEVDTQGDAFFFAFPTAAGATEAARAMTDALAPGPIQVRIGLHTGTPLLTDEGYVGDDVHFAARVASAGHGGQVILSQATAHVVELELTDLGEHRLKDIADAVSIFQLGTSSFPPLKTISNTNLPRPASSFVGREHELSEVLSRIEQGARLLALIGPGGTGKTRLALEAAASLVPEYKAGVFWIGLAALRDPTPVTETISQTLGAKDVSKSTSVSGSCSFSSTTCRSRSSSPPHGRRRSRRRRSWSVSPNASTSCRAAVTRTPGSRHSGRRSNGRTTFYPMPSSTSLAASLSSPAVARWRQRRR